MAHTQIERLQLEIEQTTLEQQQHSRQSIWIVAFAGWGSGLSGGMIATSCSDYPTPTTFALGSLLIGIPLTLAIALIVSRLKT